LYRAFPFSKTSPHRFSIHGYPCDEASTNRLRKKPFFFLLFFLVNILSKNSVRLSATIGLNTPSIQEAIGISDRVFNRTREFIPKKRGVFAASPKSFRRGTLFVRDQFFLLRFFDTPCPAEPAKVYFSFHLSIHRVCVRACQVVTVIPCSFVQNFFFLPLDVKLFLLSSAFGSVGQICGLYYKHCYDHKLRC